jgi:hypothetical protein
MYMSCNIVMHSCNNCYSGNITVHCMFVVELHMPVNCIKKLSVA